VIANHSTAAWQVGGDFKTPFLDQGAAFCFRGSWG